MRLAVAVASLLALAPVALAAPDGPALESEVMTSADDLEWLHEQYERISATKSQGVLTDEQVAQMVQEAKLLAMTVAVSGDVREMELADALDALVQAARAQGKHGSAAVVMTQAARDRLSGVAVSASFHRTPFGAAVEALVGAVGSDEPTVEVEETSRGVFVIRVHDDEDDDDQDDDDQDDERPRVLPRQEPEATPPAPPGRGDDGVAPRAYLGVQLTEAPDLRGVRIGTVSEDGPAARAGLRSGDILRAFGGQQVRSAAELLALLQRRAPGELVQVEYSRGEADAFNKVATVTLGERPAQR